jgi:molybdopterin-guanine dinucleotide biosynthesis protein B
VSFKRVHIVGRKNHGKTTLVVELIGELSNRGWRVGAVKHSPHEHPPDRPGSDSFRLGRAGALPAAFVASGGVGVFFPREEGRSYWDQIATNFTDCDIVLVEGDVDADAVKLEVWRASVGTQPLAAERTDITAMVSDDPADLSLPVFSRSDLTQVVCFLESVPP